MTGPAHTEADRVQRQAADPAASVWVSASAGTGKTKVLTDRALRLMLAQDPPRPETILCLTYTRAAASEMTARLIHKAKLWAVLDDASLDAALQDLGVLGGGAEPAVLRARARMLLGRILDVPGGLRIMTLHGFCQHVLKRFPLEAGVPPTFQVLEETDAAALMADALAAVRVVPRDADDGALGWALGHLMTLASDFAFTQAIEEIQKKPAKFRRLLEQYQGLQGAQRAVAEVLGVPQALTDDEALQAAVSDPAIAALRPIPSWLRGGGKTAKEAADAMEAWLALDKVGRIDGLDTYRSSFVTQGGLIKPNIVVQSLRGDTANEAILDHEAARLRDLDQTRKKILIRDATGALLTVADAVLRGFADRKAALGMLDYEDQIQATMRLLCDAARAPWVLYKLDGGLRHILVDEAQDTNDDQWSIIGALTDEFFAGSSARLPPRTLFAVGDRKQSIYRFQGADPAAFDAARQRYTALLRDAIPPLRGVAMETSFRSTPAVLTVVDAVLRDQVARQGVVPEGMTEAHIPHRREAAGRVMLWPLVTGTADTVPPLKPPVEVLRAATPEDRLATLLAKRIKAWVDEAPVLSSTGKPLSPGDVLILLRRRGTLAELLSRALRHEDIPVAGRDRMTLTEELAAQDVLALFRALLLPEDNLTLATVLRGPLVGLPDDALEAVCVREHAQTVWSSLREKAPHDRAMAEALERLQRLQAVARRMGPVDLLHHVLGAEGGWQAMTAQLGPACHDVLDEVLRAAETYEVRHGTSLLGFVHWFEAAAPEVKRPTDQAPGEVRIMTVHGAKGLQAPVVILPDTTGQPQTPKGPLWHEGVLLWAPTADDRDDVMTDAVTAARAADMEENHRQLYVALTRAEDWLLVCGYKGAKTPPEDTWYNAVARVMPKLSGVIKEPDPVLMALDPDLEPLQTLASGMPPQAMEGRPSTPEPEVALPSWLHEAAPQEARPPRSMAPSRVGTAPAPVSGPSVQEDGLTARRRGTLVHRLLEILPAHPGDGTTFLAALAPDLAEAQRLALLEETWSVLRAPRLAPLFGPGSRAEVPLAGVVKGHPVAGQVDRLMVLPERVLMADYKTGRVPPAGLRDVPQAYVTQMALYAALVAALYPGKPVESALVWTAGPSVTVLPPHILANALSGLS